MAPPPVLTLDVPFINENTTRAEYLPLRAGHFAQRVAPAHASVGRALSRLDRRELRLFRPPSLRARGPRGGAQAPGHVHRLDRLPRPHALPLGDHRQLGRRGARRPRRPRSGSMLHPDGSVEVRDHARGIPVDIEPKTGLSGVEVVFTKLHAGGKFGSGSYAASGGLHGVGASVVNALSERLDVEVDRDGKTWAMSFHRGEPGVFADSGTPSARRAVHAVRGPQRAARRRQGGQGRHRHPHPVLGRPADLHQGRRVPDRRAARPRAPDGVPRARARDRRPRRARSRAAHTTSFQFDGGISEFVEHLAPDAAAHRHLAPHRHRHVHRDRAGAQRRRRDDADRAVARVRGRHRAALGHRLRDRSFAVFVNIIATPKGGTHQAGFEPGAAEVPAPAGRAERAPAQGRQRQAREGRRARRAHRRAHRPAGRAAVRGADQGGARHARRARHRRQRGREGARRALRLDQARRQGAVGAAAGQGRRRDEVAHLRARPQGDPAAQERARDLVAAGEARRLPHRTTSPTASCSSSRATPRSAPPSWRATASSRRCCPSAARSSTCRRRPSPTCSATPSAPRSSR